jgi:hypothetical protein
METGTLRMQFERAPDDGHNNARNMLSSVYATKQLILQLIVASGWVFYLNSAAASGFIVGAWW